MTMTNTSVCEAYPHGARGEQSYPSPQLSGALSRGTCAPGAGPAGCLPSPNTEGIGFIFFPEPAPPTCSVLLGEVVRLTVDAHFGTEIRKTSGLVHSLGG